MANDRLTIDGIAYQPVSAISIREDIDSVLSTLDRPELKELLGRLLKAIGDDNHTEIETTIRDWDLDNLND